MPKVNPYYIPKLPETATISYYNPETDQNFTVEEWKQLNSTANPAEIRIINQGEIYHSWKIDVDYPAYGPMDFINNSDNSSALIVARSQQIISELRKNYPNVVQLLDYNRKGTILFLKAHGALTTYDIVHNFHVSSGSDSSWGPEVWRKYKEEINNYVDKMCKDLIDQDGKIVDRDLFRPAREALANHIHSEYKRELPRWPLPFCENTASIKIEISGSYRSVTNYYVVWSCSGWIDVKDENRFIFDYHARFSGRPEIKVLILDFDELGEIDRYFGLKGIEEAKVIIDRKQLEYGRQGRNLLEYWDKKYL